MDSFVQKIKPPEQADSDPFYFFVNSVRDYAIFMLDLEGRITSWNVGAERIKGYTAEEIIGQDFSCFYPEEDIRNGKPQKELEAAAKEGRFEEEGWRIRKGGSRFWANVIITAVADETGQLIGFGKVTRDCTERMRFQKALEESQKSLRDLSFHLLRAQDEERRLIGREMHDSLGQYLSVLKMRLDTMSGAEENAARVTRQQIVECAKIADECMKEVRTVSYLLYPPMLDEMGLKSAIPWYLEGFSKRSGIVTTFDTPNRFTRLPRDVELALFRVLQETLTNVHKHSGSPTAHVGLARSEHEVAMEVVDVGKGFQVTTPEEGGGEGIGILGVGLRGMSERLRQIGGHVDVSSGKTGTRIRAVVPLKVPGVDQTGPQ